MHLYLQLQYAMFESSWLELHVKWPGLGLDQLSSWLELHVKLRPDREETYSVNPLEIIVHISTRIDKEKYQI